MKRTTVLIMSVLMLFASFSACDNKGNDTPDTSRTTTGTTVTTTALSDPTTVYIPADDIFTPIADTEFKKTDKGPDTGDGSVQNAIDLSHPHARVIGHEYNVYLYFKEEYYLLLEFEAPVNEFGNAFMTDADGDGMDEIFIYDFSANRSAILVYDDEKDIFLMYITNGILYFNDYETSGAYLFYSYQKHQYPYELWLYKFADSKPAMLDVVKYTNSEYAVMAEGRFIFAGDRNRVSLYTIVNNEMISYDDTLYTRSRLVFPDASNRLISEAEFKYISRFQTDHAMDQILSKHGFVFEDEYLNYYFDIFPWYIIDHDFTADMLGNIEKKNMEILMDHQRMLESNIFIYDTLNANIDLNMDNEPDNITLEITRDSFVLTINDQKTEGMGDNLIQKLYITDIDKSDGYLEIGVAMAGPSDDYATFFYRYDGQSIIPLGRIEGAVYDMSIPGDGSMLSYKRGSILQTWFYPYLYRIDGHFLTGIDEDEYLMNTFVLLKEDLDVYEKPKDPVPEFTIRAGEPALIISSNDKDHCKILTHDGKEGFFYVSRYNLINDTGIDSGSYFHGMSFAD